MLLQIQTPNLPAVEVGHKSIEKCLLKLPWVSKVAKQRRRAELQAMARDKDDFTRWLIASVPAGDLSKLTLTQIPVSPFRALTSRGVAELSRHPAYAELLNDVERYNSGELLEADFAQQYGFSTESAFDIAFDYLRSLDGQNFCRESEETRVYKYGCWAVVIGFIDEQPAFAALGAMPSLIEAVFPDDFSDWNPTEPVWDAYSKHAAGGLEQAP